MLNRTPGNFAAIPPKRGQAPFPTTIVTIAMGLNTF
jgi:hypothetical protein